MVIASSRQPLLFATPSIAGNHCPACESPVSRIASAPVPYVHRPGLVRSYDRWQPSLTCLGLSDRARVRLGSRFFGTLAVRVAASTCRATTSASVGAAVAPVVGAAVSAGAAAAVTSPSGSGSATPVPSAAAVATPVSATPSARLRRVESVREKRTGFSTNRSVSAAGTTVATASGAPTTHDDGAARISTGKCHRYHEYDTRPIARGTARPSSDATPRRVLAQPATTTATVPSTGSAAAGPGNAVRSSYVTTASRIAARPAQPRTVATAGRSVRRRGAASATSPPAPSSHARVGSEKNAHCFASPVSHTHATNDTTTTAPSAYAARRRAATSSSGQTT